MFSCIISESFDVTEQIPIAFSSFIKYLRRREYKETVLQLFKDFKGAYDLLRREVLYNILTNPRNYSG
jgi:hypothetical protein